MLSNTDPHYTVIEFTATTHPGNRYQHNEDAIGWSEVAGLWFVADGIGGHARGDLASATVKAALLEAATAPERPLTELVMLAHEAVVTEGVEQALPNMGSTLVMARVKGDQLSVAWCGDSRAYLWRGGELIRLTRDHSLLEQLLESGIVAPEEAFGHPRRNVLVQALGITEPRPVPDEIALTLGNDDVVLLCSDGIHDELPDGTIADVLQAMTGSQAIVDELERRVLATDARDNLSVICLRVTELPASGDEVLEVKQVRDSLQTAQRSLGTTRKRVINTQEFSPTSPERGAASDTPVTTTRPAPSAAAAGSTPPPGKTGRNVKLGATAEVFAALVCVALVVCLILLFA